MLSFAVLSAAAAALVAAQQTQDCAPVPLDAQYWQTQTATALKSSNNVDGALLLSMEANAESLSAAFSTEFAEAQDLTQHSLLSFNLFKVKSPARVYVAITTPHGVYRTPPAALFEQANTITVDLASSEFASSSDATAFDEPIIGLSAVQRVALHLVAVELGNAQVTVDGMVVCAAPHADVASPVVNAAATALEFPDVASLSTALTTALAEVQRLSAEVGELRNAQRRARRSFDEFSSSVRDTLDNAVAALSSAMSANVEQTLTNAKLLQRLRERVAEASSTHDERIVALDQQFSSLRTLALKQGETLADGVARVNTEEKAAEVSAMQKRSVLLAEQSFDVAPRVAAVASTVDEAFGLNVKKASNAKSAAAPVVRAP